MADLINSGSHSTALAQPGPRPDATYKGVRGWLLVFCLMLTVIGPVISAWLITHDYARFAPLFTASRVLQAAILTSLLIAACSAAFSVYAGLRLWLIRPRAVNTAKHALLFGLAADIVTTSIDVATGQVPAASDRLLFQLEVKLIPGLIFFTLCFAYLNRSKRVHATYASRATDA